jgi:hypothetical protein
MQYKHQISEYKATEPSVEVNGTTINSTIEGTAIKTLAQGLLEKEGLPSQPDSNSWYPQQKWLNVLKEIQNKFGVGALKTIGKRIPETAKFPPDVNTIEAGLNSIGVAYRMNHKGGEIGYYKFQKTGENEGIVESLNPYPCDFNMGIVEGMAKRFVPTAKVQHQQEECRKTGGNVCKYKITW